MRNNATRTPLYEDRFCTLSDKSLKIRSYFFPIAKSKEIDLRDIQRVYYKKQARCEDITKLKSWGMSFSPVWWACDMLRQTRKRSDGYYNIAVDTGTWPSKGFSISDREFIVQAKLILKHCEFMSEQLP